MPQMRKDKFTIYQIVERFIDVIIGTNPRLLRLIFLLNVHYRRLDQILSA